jgi:hypothetical protein
MPRNFLISFISLVLILFITASAIAIKQNDLRAFLYDLTGELEFEKQVYGFATWLPNFTRAQPETADAAPMAYNGVNPFGVNTFLNQEVEDHKVIRQLDMIRDAGFKWIRQEFPWQDIEIHGKGDFQDRRHQPYRSAWDKYDRIVRWANERGIQVIARLSTPPKWSRKDGDARGTFAPPDNYKDYGDFVATVAQRYKGQITFYQIWNEPNNYPEWGEQDVSPEAYAALLKEGYTRAKAIDPECVILAAPLSSTIELGGRALNDFIYLQRMYDAGAKDYFDILSVQNYGLWSGPTDRRMRPRVLNFSRPIYIRDLMVKNGDAHKAMWASEFGWNAIPKGHSAPAQYGRATEAQVAQFTVQAYQRAQAEWPWMGVMMLWYFKQASDADKNQPYYFFKMLDPDFTPMPVYEAVKQYANQSPLMYAGYFQENHWALQWAGQWTLINDQRAVIGRYRRSVNSRDALSFTFVGTGLDIVFVRGATGGVARVTIDERAPIDIKLAAPTEQFGVKTDIVRGLTRGQHRVRIEVVETEVGLDGVIVYP